MKGYTKLLLALMVLAVVAIVLATPASQSIRAAGLWYVALGGSDSSDCLSPAAACATINGALNKPGFVAEDTVRVAAGTYVGTGNEVVLLDRNAALSGGWDAAFATQSGMSTIDGQGARRGIVVQSSVNALVTRFIIQNGFTYDDGSGIRNAGTLTLTSSLLTQNVTTMVLAALFPLLDR